MNPLRNGPLSQKARIVFLILFSVLFCDFLYCGEVYPLPDGRCPDGYRPVTRKRLIGNAENGEDREEEYYTVCLPLSAQELDALQGAQGSASRGQPARPADGGGDEEADPGGERAQVASDGETAYIDTSVTIINDTPYKLYANMDYRRRIVIVSSKNDQRFNKWWVLNYDPQVFKDVPTGKTVLHCSRGHTHTFTIYQGEGIKFYAQNCRITTDRPQ